MGRLSKIAFGLVLVWMINNTAFAQGEWPLKHIDKRLGLSNSAISSIYYDRYDHVWFGTRDGLNRYDGDAIVTYKPLAGEANSISNNIVSQILEDKDGNLWVVAHNVINRYDRELDQFHRYLHDLDHLPFVENNLQSVLTEDSTLYINRVGWGIGQYAGEEDTFMRIQSGTYGFKNIYRMGAHKEFLYLLDNHGQLLVYDQRDKAITLENHREPSPVFCSFIAFDDRYFLIYQPNANTLILKELRDGKIRSTRQVKTQQTIFTALAPGKDKKRLYLGTDEGQLFQLTSTDEGIQLASLSELSASIYTKKLRILSIHESKQNILWIGTDGDGVYKYLTKQRSFQAIGEGNATVGKISNSMVRSILADQQDNLFVGTRNGGLNVVNQNRQSTQVYDQANALSDNTVLALAHDVHGNVWMGLDSEGLDMIEKGTGTVLHFPGDFQNDTSDLRFGSVHKVFFDTYGHLWLGTSGYGIVYMDIRKDDQGDYLLHESYFINPESRNQLGSIGIESNIIHTIVEEGPNILWFGARNGGMYRYNTLTRHFTHHLQAEGEARYSLSNNDIRSLHMDGKNQLWVGTSGGLNKVNLSDFTVKQYPQSGSSTIHGILEDFMGRLWLSGNNGLVVFDPQNQTFKNFNWSDGLLNYEYSDGAHFQAPGGQRLYFGGTNGVDIVFPARLDTSTSFSRLSLTDLYISNVHITPGDTTRILSSTIDLQQEIKLNYDQNYLSLRFTTLDYWHKQRCSYRYYLEGFDKSWIDIGRQSIINLTNIPPGNYTLHLNNTNENGDWNPEIRKLSIIITPPIWATNTAHFAYIMLVLLAQGGLIHFLGNKARRKETDEIARIKQEQADIIQKYKLEFFTNIAHEFRTPLTLILGPAATLLEKTKTNPVLYQPIQNIYRNSLRLQKLIQELIQFRKVELGKEKLRIRSLNLVAFVEDLLQSFRQHALEKEIVLTYEGPDTLSASLDSEILEKILINLVSNALKYTDHGGEVHVNVSSDAHQIHFSVRDTGIGIHSHELSQVFERFAHHHHEGNGQTFKSAGIGLSLTKKLIHLHQGDITVESTPGQGTHFTFWLPANLRDTESLTDADNDHAMLSRIDSLVQAEFYQNSAQAQEMVNISLERFDHNILVVDDNVQILSLLKDLLSSRYNIIPCTSGAEALAVVSNRKIDLVISDVIMPEMDGYTFCDTIKNRIETSHIPVILLTAKGDIEERIEGLQAGADAYIPKPFHPDHLYVRIEKLIRTREILKQKFESFSQTEDSFSSFGIGSKDDEFFRQVDQFIKDEMGNPQLDAQHLASHVGMSKTSLYKKVRTLTGQTPHAMINQYRLKKAAFLLTHSDLNVSEIIYKTGFNSRSYFYKSFQEMFHCSPSGYGEWN